MTLRERVIAALSHRVSDKVPVDLGGCSATGIHDVALHHLRNAFGHKKIPVKLWEPMMMLGLVEEDVRKAVGSDVIGINSPVTLRFRRGIHRSHRARECPQADTTSAA